MSALFFYNKCYAWTLIVVASFAPTAFGAEDSTKVMPTEAEGLKSWETPIESMYERRHSEVQTIDEGSWTLVVDGLVERPLTLNMKDLKRLSLHRYHAVLSCSGLRYGQGWLAGNIEWGGVLLRDLLQLAGVKQSAKYIHFVGADASPDFTSLGYTQSVPIEGLFESNPMIGIEMNRQPLLPKHGAPARAVLPGWQGYKWVKWLKKISISDRASSSSVLFWNYLNSLHSLNAQSNSAKERVQPSLVISEPRFSKEIQGETLSIRGHAFSASGSISRVSFSIDGGKVWHVSNLTEPKSPAAWQSFTSDLSVKKNKTVSLSYKIEDNSGQVRIVTGNQALIFGVEN